jgi:hypothetical protein
VHCNQPMIELTACDPSDRDGERTASVLVAYFKVEHSRAVRRLLWRWLAVAAVGAWLVAATTPLLPGNSLLAALIACAAAAGVAAVAEWRAETILRASLAAWVERIADVDPSTT